jgi:hypothetical protein
LHFKKIVFLCSWRESKEPKMRMSLEAIVITWIGAGGWNQCPSYSSAEEWLGYDVYCRPVNSVFGFI